ncbi:MAG TPA: GNAT family N-acetyltransferase [Vicinamibacteria bacterium]|nr:GNAT family N-acetyltransferase [Vicinamibacteria bacterium]
MRTRPLRDVSIRELRGLLDEESAAWRSELAWDFSDVRAAVAAGVERGTLPGRAVSDGSRALAYCYYMVDAGRVIIGSVYAGQEQRGRGLEEALVEAVIGDARAERGSSRVECQTLFCTSEAVEGRFAAAGFASRPRHYMSRDLRQPLPAADPALPRGVCLRPLGRDELQAAAEIVYRSHVGSVDAALNLTYATPAACRAFVDTLVLRSGCGRFDEEASRVAEGPKGAVGVLIASRLCATNGHVCQVSVAPQVQGRGVGAALMSLALHAFRAQGLATATLSVTVSNRRAHRLYERLGYRVDRRFAAHAWVRPPARIELPA